MFIIESYIKLQIANNILENNFLVMLKNIYWQFPQNYLHECYQFRLFDCAWWNCYNIPYK